VAGWLVPSTGQKIPVKPGWCFPPQKIPQAENRFLQAANGAENYKGKIREVIYVYSVMPEEQDGPKISTQLRWSQRVAYFFQNATL
jgi:hypothetical protein